MQHFIVFLAGSLLLIIINPVLGIGKGFFIKNWFVWAILMWALLFLVHLLNVFILNRFMGKEWEDRQMDRLKAKQQAKIDQMALQVEKEITTSQVKKRTAPGNPKSMITLIAAAGERNELGKDNELVWHLPDDFKRFKQLTTGHCIIMGRKTFESFPKPLPNRTHIVITRNTDYQGEGIIVVASMEEALLKAEDDSQPFIIGGGEIYRLGLPFAQKIELTRVHATFEADTFFPEIPEEEWVLESVVRHEKDDRHAHAFSYLTYLRK